MEAALAEAEAFYAIDGLAAANRQEAAYSNEHLQFSRAVRAVKTLQELHKQTLSTCTWWQSGNLDWLCNTGLLIAQTHDALLHAFSAI